MGYGFIHRVGGRQKASSQNVNSYSDKVSGREKMLKGLKSVIVSEIENNKDIDQTSDYSVLVRKKGDQGVDHFMSVSKEDLEQMWYKIDHLEECKSGTSEGLAPRELEALSLIILSVERGDFAIKQGNNLFTKKQGLYEEIRKKANTVQKAQNLAERKIIGKDGNDIVFVKKDVKGNIQVIKKNKEGEIVGRFSKSGKEAEDYIRNIEGVYNVDDENIKDVNAAYGGLQVFDESEFTDEVGEELDGVEDADLSKDFVDATRIFKRTFMEHGAIESGNEANVEAADIDQPSRLEKAMNERRNDQSKEKGTKDKQSDTSELKKEAVLELKDSDRLGEEEAHTEAESIQRLEEELDEKHDRILQESELHFQNKDEQKKAA